MLFQDIKLSKFLLNALEEAGITEMTPVQEAVIPKVLSGQDVLGISPTGTGKTLAYLLPLLRQLSHQQGSAPRLLVVVPTKELVMQLMEVIRMAACYTSLRAVPIFGGGSKLSQVTELEEGADIVISTPGRIQEMVSIRALNLKSVKHLVLDEADTLLDESFRTQMRYLMDSLPEKRQNIMFSATFSKETQQLAHQFLVNPSKVVIGELQKPAPNISQKAFDVPNIKTKLNLLADLLNDSEVYQKVMVFTETKKVADRVQQFLHHRLFAGKANVIHSNKTENFRLRQISEFKEGLATVLVATGVAGKGVDVEGVSHVINFEVPHEYEDYVHRIGRTGRNDAKGEAVTFVEPAETEDFQNLQALLGECIDLLPLPEDTWVVEMPASPPDADRRGNSVKHKNQKKEERGAAFHEKKEKNTKINKRIVPKAHLSAKAKKTQGLKSNGRPRKRRK
ncbi:MAG: DEAD/DEAH box helicase [Cytophagales bacterium]|nr:DEAD/DEAH box helicase [Cytophagales bacterium]